MQGCLKPVGFRTSAYLPPEAPFLSAAKEMGERTPPKTHGFWISFKSARPEGPHQHLPPTAASARFDNRLKTVEPCTPAFCTFSGSGDRSRSIHISGGFAIAAFVWDAQTRETLCGARADFQTAGLNGVFGHFCLRRQK